MQLVARISTVKFAEDHRIIAQVGCIDPRVQCELRCNIEIVSIRHIDSAAAIKLKSLTHLAWPKRYASLEYAVVIVLNIIGIVVTRPPADHPARRRCARSTFTGASPVV